jgi:ATP-dependent RNA helicase DDX46/PRP5
MVRRDRSYSPEASNKRVRPSHRSSRSPSPTRRTTQRPTNRSRYDGDREKDWERDRDRDRRDRDRARDRHRDDRYRDDRRREPYRDDRREDRRRDRDRPLSPPASAPAPASSQPETPRTPPVEDEKLKSKRAKLEAWKKEREAKKALDEATAKAMALAGKGTLRMSFSNIIAKNFDFTSLDPTHCSSIERFCSVSSF